MCLLNNDLRRYEEASEKANLFAISLSERNVSPSFQLYIFKNTFR